MLLEPLPQLGVRLKFGMLAARESSSMTHQSVVTELLRIFGSARMRSRKFVQPGVQCPPQGVCTWIKESGESLADPIGHRTMSPKRDAVHTCREPAATAGRNRPETVASDVGPGGCSAGTRARVVRDKALVGAERIGRSFIPGVMQRFVASGRSWSRLGVDPSHAIARPGRTDNRGSTAGEDGTCAPAGSRPASSATWRREGNYARGGTLRRGGAC